MLDIKKYDPLIEARNLSFEEFVVSVEGVKDRIIKIIDWLRDKIKQLIDFLFKRDTVKKLEEEKSKLAEKLASSLKTSFIDEEQKNKYENEIAKLKMELDGSRNSNINLNSKVDDLLNTIKEMENKNILDKKYVQVDFQHTIRKPTLDALGLNENTKTIEGSSIAHRYKSGNLLHYQNEAKDIRWDKEYKENPFDDYGLNTTEHIPVNVVITKQNAVDGLKEIFKNNDEIVKIYNTSKNNLDRDLKQSIKSLDNFKSDLAQEDDDDKWLNIKIKNASNYITFLQHQILIHEDILKLVKAIGSHVEFI